MTFGNRTTTGVVGMTWLFPMLDRYGYGDVALSVLLNDAYPSIGHMAYQNMTTLCENWACTFHDAGGGSQNHIMLGGFDGWLVTSVGGLDTGHVTGHVDEGNGAPIGGHEGAGVVGEGSGEGGDDVSGWRRVIVRVSPAAVTMVRGPVSFQKETRFGPVRLEWALVGGEEAKWGAGEGGVGGDTLWMNLTTPVGTLAVVHAPDFLEKSGRLVALREGGVVVWRRAAVGGERKVSQFPRGVMSVESSGGADGGAMASSSSGGGGSLSSRARGAVLAVVQGGGVYRFEAEYRNL
jgi:hypothetical protein